MLTAPIEILLPENYIGLSEICEQLDDIDEVNYLVNEEYCVTEL